MWFEDILVFQSRRATLKQRKWQWKLPIINLASFFGSGIFRISHNESWKQSDRFSWTFITSLDED